jgi:uncharacterized protein (TIGR03643 family)
LFILFFLHPSLQYKTLSQFFSHFFRHTNGRLQVLQVLVGKFDFFIPLIRCITFRNVMGFRCMLNEEEMDRIIAMAWEDRTPFEAIKMQFGLAEDEVVELMRKNLRNSSWRRWRERVNG